MKYNIFSAIISYPAECVYFLINFRFVLGLIGFHVKMNADSCTRPFYLLLKTIENCCYCICVSGLGKEISVRGRALGTVCSGCC